MGCGKGDVADRAQELDEACVSLADIEKWAAIVREAYGEMSALAYESMLSLRGSLAEVGVLIEPPDQRSCEYCHDPP